MKAHLELMFVPMFGYVRALQAHLLLSYTHFRALVSTWWELFVCEMGAPNEIMTAAEVDS